MTTKTPDDPRLPDAADAAGDRFIHGLLGFLHYDDRAIQGKRIARVMDTIQVGPPPQKRRRRRRLTRGVLIGAVAAVVMGMVYLLQIPTEQSAYAFVDAAIDAGRAATNRRYSIEVQAPHDEETRPIGTIDLRPGQMLVRLRTPEGHLLIAGRDHVGEWVIRDGETAERLDAHRALPRWISMGDETILVESVDAVLEWLRDGYALELALNDEVTPDRKHIIAVRDAVDEARPGPDRVDIWILTDTRLVELMSLQWDDMGPPRGDGRGPAPMPPPPSDGQRPPPPPLPPHGGPPVFLDGPPRFGRDHHPPPRRIVFELVEPPLLAEGWFSPEVHVVETQREP